MRIAIIIRILAFTPLSEILFLKVNKSFTKITILGLYYPGAPSIQIVPLWGLKSINSTYFGLFGAPGLWYLKINPLTRTQEILEPSASNFKLP